MTEVLATLHNDETNMSAMVFVSTHSDGGFGVAVRDDDSGEFLGTSFHGLATIDAAKAKAAALIN